MTREHAFKMQLKPGAAEEYRRRHDAIWPDLASLLSAVGIGDYSIWLDPEANHLFGTLTLADGGSMDHLPETEVVKRWWAFMADIMATDADNVPVQIPLKRVFHLP